MRNRLNLKTLLSKWLISIDKHYLIDKDYQKLLNDRLK
jgi:hypothetical protein